MRIGDLFDGLDSMWVEHGERVGSLATLMGEAFDLPESSIGQLRLAARLHDVGKAHIDRRLLEKPGALTPQEWAVVHAHPRIGFEVVKTTVGPEVARMVLFHHERHDGRGYPHGLAGSRIPLGARILAAIDAFDAMVSDRPYSAAMPVTTALGELRGGAGTQFDPDVIEVVEWALANEYVIPHAGYGLSTT